MSYKIQGFQWTKVGQLSEEQDLCGALLQSRQKENFARVNVIESMKMKKQGERTGREFLDTSCFDADHVSKIVMIHFNSEIAENEHRCPFLEAPLKARIPELCLYSDGPLRRGKVLAYGPWSTF